MDRNLFDYITRIDDYLLRTNEILAAMKAGLVDRPQDAKAMAVRFNELNSSFWGMGGQQLSYKIEEVSLASALADKELNVVGDNFAVATDGTLVGVKIRLNSLNGDQIPLYLFNPYHAPTGFSKLFITAPAQTGKKLVIHVSTGVRNQAWPIQSYRTLNLDAISTAGVTLTVAGTAEALPDVDVPEGHVALITAKYTNTGRIYFGGTAAEAQAKTFSLRREDFVGLPVTNLNKVFYDADVTGEGLDYLI